MPDYEKSFHDFSRFELKRFQPVPGYKDHERAPRVVISQTHNTLKLYRAGVIGDPKFAKDYIRDYTFGYLNTAAEGVERVFTKAPADIQPLEMNKAADVAHVVFAWMHYFAESKYLPMGFSRKGMLEAPTTKRQFIGRIAELKRELAFIVTGMRDPEIPLEATPGTSNSYLFSRRSNPTY